MGRSSQPRASLVVQWRGEVPRGGTRSEQRADLAARLALLLNARPGIAVDWDSLSLAAQTVVIDVDEPLVASVRRSLESQGLRVDDDMERQIVDDRSDGDAW